MISQILPFLNQLLPAGLAVKGLSKLDPRMSKFFTNAAAAGFGTSAALDYLRNKFTPEGKQSNERSLKEGNIQGTLRPDESAALQSNQEANRGLDLAKKGISGAVGLGAGLLGDMEGSPEKNRKSPLQIGMDSPQSMREIEDLRERGGAAQTGELLLGREGTKLQREDGMSRNQQAEQPRMTRPQQKSAASTPFKSFLSQYPDVGNYLDKLMGQGMSPLQAVTEAKKKKTIMNDIADIEEAQGQDLESLIGQLFGGTERLRSPTSQGGSSKNADLINAIKRLGDLQGRRG